MTFKSQWLLKDNEEYSLEDFLWMIFWGHYFREAFINALIRTSNRNDFKTRAGFFCVESFSKSKADLVIAHFWFAMWISQCLTLDWHTADLDHERLFYSLLEHSSRICRSTNTRQHSLEHESMNEVLYQRIVRFVEMYISIQNLSSKMISAAKRPLHL